MDTTCRILLIPGSLRRRSTNMAVLRTARAIAPEGSASLLFEGLATLPPFNPDADTEPLPGAVTNNPPASGVCFQFHHQPFAYFQRWGSSSPDNFKAHLQDEQNFFADLKNETLPSVAFVKPVGVDNEHPNYSGLIAGQNHVQQLLAALCSSKYWPSTAVIIAYDENGGRWDHVHPPAVDQWGPGDRVPAIIVSPYAKAGFVDHTQYETVSILALIEKRFDLPSLNARDAKANPLLDAFDFNQLALACQP